MSSVRARDWPPFIEPAIIAMALSRKPWGVAIFANSHGAPGTDNTPVLELISTSRRHRPACCTANCCASAPPRDPPTPGASNRMMSMPGSRASTSDCSTSKLVPMPPHISSGVPVPSPALTSTRNCWRQTVTCRVVLGFEVFGTTAAGDGSGSLFGPSRTPDHGFTGPPTTAVPTGVTVTVPTFPRAERSHAQPPMRTWFRPGNRPSTGCSPAPACGGRTDGNDLSPRVARSLPACRKPERMRGGKNRFLPGNSREESPGQVWAGSTLAMSRPVGRRRRPQPAVAFSTPETTLAPCTCQTRPPGLTYRGGICPGRRGWSRSWRPGRPPRAHRDTRDQNSVGTYNVCTAVAMVTMKLEGNSSASRRRSHQTLAGTGFTNARRPRTVVRSGFDRSDSGDLRHAAESGPTGRSRERQEPVSSGAVAELCATPGNHHLPDPTRRDLTMTHRTVSYTHL